jgi:hypothetical protein
MLVKNEKSPSVIMLKGKDKIFKIGFRKTRRMVKAIPPNK